MFKRSFLSTSIAVAVALSAQSVSAQEEYDESAIEEVVVTGIRASLTKAIDVKRENFQIVDAIVAEDIGKFPDNNLAEALQRVPGVQVTDRGAGEVSRVAIRGLDDVTTTVNGRNIFTASGRSVALADVPASLLKEVVVLKTRSASMIESGIAGQIDIKTHRPFDFEGRKISVAGRAIYQELSEETDPSISALFSNRWETGAGEFGALLNVSYAETNYRDQNVTAGAQVPFASGDGAGPFGAYERMFLDREGVAENPIWQPGLEQGLPFAPGSTLNINGEPAEYLLARDALFQNDFTGKRERPAANISLQFAPNDSSEYLFETFYNGYRNESFNNLFFTFVDAWWDLADKPDPVLFEGTNIIKERVIGDTAIFSSGDLTVGETDSYVYTLGGKWDLSKNLSLRSEIVYQESDYELYFFAMRADTRGDAWIDFNGGNNIPAFGIIEEAPAGATDVMTFGDVQYVNADMTDLSRWTTGTLYDNANSYSGDALTWTADGNYQFENGLFTEVNFGLRVDQRTAEEAQSAQLAECVTNCSFSNYEGLAYINSGFFDGESNVPTSWAVPNGHYIDANQDTFRSAYGLTRAPLERSFEIEETTYNAYIQGNFETEVAGRKLDGQIGVRYTGTETDMTFWDLNQGTPGERPASSATADTSKILPSIMVRYHIQENLLARVAYTETLRNPTFLSLNANINYVEDTTNIGYGTATGGNPDLKPVESQNLDISLEWYFAPSSSLHATWFQRDIEGFVIDFRRMVEFENYNYVLSQPYNASNGKLDGLELGLTYFPENLPGVLDGFGVQFSYTVLDSSQDIPETDNSGEVTGTLSRPLFGVSDSSYSAVLAYEKDKFDARLSYVWRDDFLNNYEAANFANPLGIYRSAETSLDLQISYDVTDNLTLTFDGTNLTNEIYQSYYQYPSTHNFSSSLYSRTFALGARLSF
jgi:TonB-dependent receptor